MRAPFRILAAVAALMAAAPAPAQMLDFEALDGWREDSHADALATFLRTCDLIDAPDWRPICAVAADVPKDDISARSFFELFFKRNSIRFIGAAEIDGARTAFGNECG